MTELAETGAPDQQDQQHQQEEFERLRPLLFSIGYRLLGSVSEAEDVVQETWLRCHIAATRPISTKAYLSAVVTRLSIDQLRSARRRRDAYVGPWFPEPLLDDPYEDPERALELADSLSMAALLLLERLTPLERAAFVLRDVFGFTFADVAAAVGRSEAACRQLVVRARRHVSEGRWPGRLSRRPQPLAAEPFGPRELTRAYLAGALSDAHVDDSEFGHRLLDDEARGAGQSGCDRTAWRICHDQRWWSSFGKKRGPNGKKPGRPPMTTGSVETSPPIRRTSCG